MRSTKRFDLSQLESFITPVLLIDTIFRGLALLGLLWNLSTYLPSIGLFMVLVKVAMYVAGIAANIAILNQRPWGTHLGFGVAGVGIWLVLTDAWSLFHGLLRGPFRSALPATLFFAGLGENIRTGGLAGRLFGSALARASWRCGQIRRRRSRS